MPSLKDIKRRITSVKTTRQTTSAMKLVSGAKLRRATEAALAARPYADKLTEVLGRVSARVGENVSHPLLTRSAKVETVALAVMISDRGLCGPFNAQLLRKADDFIAAREAEGQKVVVLAFGKKAVSHYRSRGRELAIAHDNIGRTSKEELAGQLRDAFVAGFTGGEYDECVVLYNRFGNVLIQEPTEVLALPLSVEASEESEETLLDYKYEPANDVILGALLPLYLETRLLQTFLDTEAGEHAARMTAMDNATRNASEVIGQLTLQYNRARQAAITKELIEIVSGAEAL